MKNHISFLFASLAISFSACSNLDSSNVESDFYDAESHYDYGIYDTFSKQDTAKYIYSKAENIGRLHNACMDTLKAKHANKGNLIDILYTYAVDNNYCNPSDSVDFRTSTRALLYSTANNLIPVDSLSVIDDEIIPGSWKKTIESVVSVINEERDTTMAMNKLRDIENGVMKSPQLSITDKVAITSAIEIAAASYQYNIIDEPIGLDASSMRKVVGADFIGAVSNVGANFLIGKYSGMLVFGPEGVVVAVTSDALIGGIRKSGSALIQTIIGHFW